MNIPKFQPIYETKQIENIRYYLISPLTGAKIYCEKHPDAEKEITYSDVKTLVKDEQTQLYEWLLENHESFGPNESLEYKKFKVEVDHLKTIIKLEDYPELLKVIGNKFTNLQKYRIAKIKELEWKLKPIRRIEIRKLLLG